MPATSDPLVSIVIPTWNRAAVLPRALTSVLGQTFTDFEVVVVDDGSTDETPTVLSGYADRRVRSVRQVNQGESAARNTGARNARGRILMFLDSDDEVKPDWVAKLAEDLLANRADLSLCGRELAVESGETSTWVPDELAPTLDEVVNHFEAGQVAFDRDRFLAAGGYCAEIRFGQHTELAIRLLCKSPVPPRLTFVALPLVIVHRQAGDRGYGSARSESARYVLDHHPECRDRLPHLWASYLAIAGVDLARRGDLKSARQRFAASLRSEPRQWRHTARWVVSTVPPLATRVWPDPTAPRGAPGAGPVVLYVAIAPGLGGSMRSLATVLSHMDGLERAVACPPDTTFTEFLDQRSLCDEWVLLRHEGRSRLVARLSAAWVIARWSWRNRNRLVAIHANGLAERTLVTPAAALAKRRVVVWMHEWSVSAWARRLAPILAWLAPTTVFAAVSEHAKASLVESGLASADNVTVIANPIDPADVVAERRCPQDRVVVGYVGTPARYKGFQFLPALIEATAGDHLEWRIYAGPRTMMPEIWAELERVESGVHIPGKVIDIRAAYGACDIIICPSQVESFGRVAAEAMCNGLPVVATDIPPLRDLLGENEAGLLVPPGDADAMAGAVTTLASDAELRERLGSAGRRRAATFQPVPIVRALIDLYRGAD